MKKSNHLFVFITYFTSVNIVLLILLTLFPMIRRVQAATSTATDDFETSTYSGGSGWAGSWVETGDGSGPTGGGIQIVTDDGDKSLMIAGKDRGISRTVNTSTGTVALLSFDYRRESLEASNEYVTIEASSNGGSTWTEIGRVQGVDGTTTTDSSYATLYFDVTSYISTQTAIRFFASPNVSYLFDYFYFDNVKITYGTSPDLALLKSDSIDPAVLGNTFNYLLTVRNQGTTATGVTATDTLPVGLTYVTAVASQGSCSESGGTVTCSLGSLNFNATANITITLAAPSTGSYTNNASVTLTETDGDTSNNNASEATTVNAGPANTCYSAADTGDWLAIIDLSGPSTSTASSALGVTNVEAIAYWSGTGTLYGTHGATLGTIDVTTGVFTTIGSAGSGDGSLGTITFSDLDSLTFDPFTGTLYASERRAVVSTDDDLLVQIDPSTGAIVQDAFGTGVDYVAIPTVGFGLYDIDDLAISTVDGTMYAVQNNSGSTDHLITVDKTTGASTDIAQFQDSTPSNVNDMEGLGYDIDGTFYGSTGASSFPAGDANYYWTINTSTAVATQLVALPTSAAGPTTLGDYEGADCLVGSMNTIAGTVFHDLFGDGTMNGSDTGTSSITVRLYRDANANGLVDSGDTLLTTKDTDASGNYFFSMAATGNFVLEIDTGDLPSGHAMTTDNVETASFSGTGNVDASNDFGHRGSASIGDLVWLDADGDGVHDTGEPGIPNVTVDLTWAGTNGTLGDSDDVSYSAQTTDSNGNYDFSNLPDGNFQVNVNDTTLPSGLSASPGNGDPLTAALTAGQDDDTADFGYANSSSANAIIGDLVWSDNDGDGVRDPGEPGIGSVTVALKGAGADGIFGTGDDTTAATATTTAGGTYLFTGVTPGDYIVDVTDTGNVLTGYTLTSGAQSNTDPTAPITVIAGQTYLNADFGYQPPASQDNSAGDLIWHDRDADGGKDAGEPGLEGISVALIRDADNSNTFNSGDSIIATILSDSSGAYLFDGIPDGNYLVWVNDVHSILNGMRQTGDPDEAGACSTCDNLSEVDLDPTSASATGVSDLTKDFGYTRAGVIGDTVFSDNNGDGSQAPGEPGIGSVTVQLWKDADSNSVFDNTLDTLLSTTTTDDTGHYLFTNLSYGTYFASVDDTQAALTGYSATTTDQETGGNASGTQIEVVLASASESNLDADFGYQYTALADISGAVWHDQNENAVDDSESQIQYVTIALVDSSGDVIATGTTDASGNYAFRDVPNGSYTVEVTDDDGVLAGYHLTSGLDEYPVTVSGSDVTNIDFGYDHDPKLASIGDFVWFDADRDGAQDATETGIPNVTLTLYRDVDGDGVAEPAGDDSGGSVATTTADASGLYNFDGLQAGNYFVDLTDTNNMLTGLSVTTGTSDPGSVIHLSNGEDYDDADFGYADDTPGTNSAIGDRVWYDSDGDGVQDPSEVGISGVTVRVYDSGSTLVGSDTTDSAGFWLVTGLTSGSNYRVDADTTTLPGGYNTTPTNGSASRTYIVPAGKDVLYADFGFNGGTVGAIGDTIWLDVDGDGTQDAGEGGIGGVTVSLFDSGSNLVNSTVTDAIGEYNFVGLPDGAYTVRVTDVFGILDALIQTGDPDETGTCATCDEQGSATITSGSTDNTVDFGYQPAGGANSLGSIGNFVWHDLDGSGVVATGESGMQGVTVDLYLDVNSNSTLDSGTDNLLRTTTTDGNGEYQFTGLPDETYLVDVTDVNSVLSGFSKTSGTANTDNNSQADPYAITLSGASNVTADFGYNTATPYTLSGSVFNDLNQDASYDSGSPAPIEPFFASVPIFLFRDLDGDGVLDPDEPLIGTTASDANGDYSFTDLPNGNYLVTADASTSLPTSMIQTTQTSTPDPAIENVTISGANVIDQDFGFYAPAEISNLVWYDSDNNGVQGSEPGVSGVVVSLYEDKNGNGIAEPGGGDGSAILTATTDTSGNYSFTGMKPGDYFVVFTLPSGYSFTTQDTGGDDTLDSDPDTTNGQTVVFALGTGEIDVTLDAGLKNSTLDYGDLPSSFGATTLADNGARHTTGSLTLGSVVDVDPDGQENSTATGDDTDGSDDDEGVVRKAGLNGASNGGGWTVGTVVAGEGGSLEITISGGSGTPQVFLDFGNGSGGFSGTLTEVTLRNSGGGALTMPLSAGINQVYFDVPGSTFGASTQPVAGRVRLSSAGGLTATGPAADGEVEDYIWNFGPTAITLTSLSASSAPARQAVALVLVAALAALIGLALLVRSRREMG